LRKYVDYARGASGRESDKFVNRFKNYVFGLLLIPIFLFQAGYSFGQGVEFYNVWKCVSRPLNLFMESRQFFSKNGFVYVPGIIACAAGPETRGRFIYFSPPTFQKPNEISFSCGNTGSSIPPFGEAMGKKATDQDSQENLGYGIKRLVHDLILVAFGVIISPGCFLYGWYSRRRFDEKTSIHQIESESNNNQQDTQSK
jgi:hypothetical protein